MMDERPADGLAERLRWMVWTWQRRNGAKLRGPRAECGASPILG